MSESDAAHEDRIVAIERAKNELRVLTPKTGRFFVQWCVVTAMVVVYHLASSGGDWSLFGVFCVLAFLVLGYEIHLQFEAAKARARIVMALLEQLEE